MIKKTYIIENEHGIHARPAGIMVKTSSEFKSDIRLSKAGKTANAKSLFSIIGLGVIKDDALNIEIEGEDEEKAYLAIKDVLLSDFQAKELPSDDDTEQTVIIEKIKVDN